MDTLANVDRFTGLADSYVKARPHYPAAILQMLRSEFGLTEGAAVAADLFGSK